MRLMNKKMRRKMLKKSRETDCFSTSNKLYVLAEFVDTDGGWIWMVTHAQELSSGDLLMYGFSNAFKDGWGYILLSDLESIDSIKEVNRYRHFDTTVELRRRRLGL